MDDASSKLKENPSLSSTELKRAPPLCAKCLQRPIAKIRRKFQRPLKVTKHYRKRSAYCWICQKEEKAGNASIRESEVSVVVGSQFLNTSEALCQKEEKAGNASIGESEVPVVVDSQFLNTSEALFSSVDQVKMKERLRKLGERNSSPAQNSDLRVPSQCELSLDKLPSGLANLGNTCYLGAALQVLLLCKNFVQWIMDESGHNVYCRIPCLHCGFKTLNEKHKSGEIVHLGHFLSILKEFVPFVRQTNFQNDAHEVLTYILSRLDTECFLQRGMDEAEALLDTSVSGLLARTFGFYIQAQSRCANNHHWKNVLFKQFQILLSVDTSLQLSLDKELLPECVEAYCSECGTSVSKQKWWDFASFPPNLLVHLNRFGADGGKNSAQIFVNQRLNVKGRVYQLRSMILHAGITSAEGHYIAVSKVLLNGTPVWCKVDDSQVTTVPPSSLNSPHLKSSVYILLYDLLPSPEPVKPVMYPSQHSPLHASADTSLGSTASSGTGGSAIRSGKPFTSQLQNAICNIHEAFKYLKERSLLAPGLSPSELTARFLGISDKIVRHYVQRFHQGLAFETPGKKRKKSSPVTSCDTFTKVAIQNLIYLLRKTNEHITVKKLLFEIRQRGIDFKGSLESLRLVLKDMGFRYKSKNQRLYLMELPNIVMQRMKFVQAYKKLKESGKYKFLWLDETWIFRYGSFQGKEWRNENPKSCSVRVTNNGQRYIVLHCGGRNGWVGGASLVFKSKANDGDYHGEMNGENFERWTEHQLAPFISEDTVIIMDNARYHKRKGFFCEEKQFAREGDDMPRRNFRRQEVIDWLNARNIPFDQKKTVPQLIDLAFRNTGEMQELNVQKILKKYCKFDVKILWTPPYHCHLNPIEFAWSTAKKYFEDHVRACKSEEEMMRLWDVALQRHTPTMWENCVKKVERLIDEIFQKECSATPPDCTDYSQFKIKVQEDDFGIEDTDMSEEEYDPQPPSTDLTPRLPSKLLHSKPPSTDLTPRLPSKLLHSNPRKRSLQYSEQESIIELSDDEVSALSLLQNNQEVLMSLWDECTELASCGTLHATFHDHGYSSYPLLCASRARQLAENCKPARLMAQVNKHDVMGVDIKLLSSGSWLNDKIINAYMQLLMQRSRSHSGYPQLYVYDTLFYTALMSRTYSGVQSWTKKMDIFTNDLVGVPVNIENTHWFLIVLDMRYKTITLYDSMLPKGGTPVQERYVKSLLDYFCLECLRKRFHPFPVREWRAVVAQDAPQQGPGGDCGVFACQVMECLSRNSSAFTCIEENIDLYRCLMIHEIVSGSVFPWPMSASVQPPNCSLQWPLAANPVKKTVKRKAKEDVTEVKKPTLNNIKVINIILKQEVKNTTQRLF